MQRLGAVGRLPKLLSELGLSAEMVLDGFPIAPCAMRSDVKVPFRLLFDLFARCEAATGRDDFGLMLGLMSDMRDLGPVGEICCLAPTLGRALTSFVSMQMTLSQGLAVHVLGMDDTVALGLGVYGGHGPGLMQMYGTAVGTAAATLRYLSGGAVSPVEVHFSHRAPTDQLRFFQALKSPVMFNQPQSCLVFPTSGMAAPNPHADPARFLSSLVDLRRQLGLDRAPVSVRLRHLLRGALNDQTARPDELARALSLSKRTLNRKLSQEGTSFERERDRMRHAMACELLMLTELEIIQISAAVGYANHSAFGRAFRRWTGVTPSAWRDHQKRSEVRA